MQYVSRIDAQIAVRFCAMCSIYIMPKALGDISIVSILSEDAFFIRQSCVCRHFAILPQCNVGIYSRADHQVVPSSEQVTNVAILIECAPPPPPLPLLARVWMHVIIPGHSCSRSLCNACCLCAFLSFHLARLFPSVG